MDSPTRERARSTEARSWVGALLGCTLWIALLGLDVQRRAHPGVGGALVALAAVGAVFGWAQWKRRGRLGRRRALRRAVAGAGLVAFLALLMLDVAGPSFFELGYVPEPKQGPEGLRSALGAGYPVLVVYVLVVWRLGRGPRS